MSRCNDRDLSIREAAGSCFARLVDLRLVSSSVEEKEESNNQDIVFPQNATLRSYQMQGIQWLLRSGRRGLHPLLADDMGLGKTLMTLCTIYSHTSSKSNISLIVCPSTLTRHWILEISKFFPSRRNVSVEYTGSHRALPSLPYDKDTIVVTSYAILRQDVKTLERVTWNYVVLDEGHRIRNPKAAVSKAAFRMNASRRVVLSGTPLQNATSDVWSIFRFLAPGYFGSRVTFREQFERPVELSRRRVDDESANLKAREALNKLRERLKPFVLRRLKTDVLKDLPPRT